MPDAIKGIGDIERDPSALNIALCSRGPDMDSISKKIERLRGERDQIKFVDLRFKRWQVVGFRKARRRQDVP